MDSLIDYSLPEKEFKATIEAMIVSAKKSDSVLPFPAHREAEPIELLACLMSQINCEKCDARCCKSPTFAEFGIPFTHPEYNTLVQRLGKEAVSKLKSKPTGSGVYFETPCPFKKKDQCTIYDIRPLPCILFPFFGEATDNEGKSLVTVDPLCPEARRITKKTYNTLRILSKVVRLAEENRSERLEAVKEELKMMHENANKNR